MGKCRFALKLAKPTAELKRIATSPADLYSCENTCGFVCDISTGDVFTRNGKRIRGDPDCGDKADDDGNVLAQHDAAFDSGKAPGDYGLQTKKELDSLPWRLSMKDGWRPILDLIQAPSLAQRRAAASAAEVVKADMGATTKSQAAAAGQSEMGRELVRKCTPFEPVAKGKPDLFHTACVLQTWLSTLNFNAERPADRKLTVPAKKVRHVARDEEEGPAAPLPVLAGHVALRIVVAAGGEWWYGLVSEMAEDSLDDTAHHVNRAKSPPVVTCWPVKTSNNYLKSH